MRSGIEKEEFKRGEAPLPNKLPLPSQGRGTQGVGCNIGESHEILRSDN
jgi:hypothetical protein